jgi:endogenous inhibitor of DNA gyrase (YacG/DUF329 family)
MPAADDPKPRPARGRCPVCGRAADARHRPFCSARCAQIDLGRWLTGGYAIASEEEPDPGHPEDGPPGR